ncbi:unnamed protein product [Linum trigynum]|uniref:Transposase n=1 Tax=Linum trigynum TaxID=586398 RepID=A0AAV2CEW6_9ROSI
MGGVKKARCNYCNSALVANGTSTLRTHKDNCLAKIARGDLVVELPSSFEGQVHTLGSWQFNQTDARRALAEMIILDELPFRYVEHEGFKRFMSRVCPMFVLPSRQTVREDCIKVFFENRDMLKDYFKAKCLGMVSLTTDWWTSLSNLNYMCVTAHFIGRDWKLYKKIINFVQITKHSGNEIGKQLASCLVD